MVNEFFCHNLNPVTFSPFGDVDKGDYLLTILE
jgi:hypothetical protein